MSKLRSQLSAVIGAQDAPILWHTKRVFATVPFVAAVVGALAALNLPWVEEHFAVIILVGVHWVAIMHLVGHVVVYRCPDYYGSPTVRTLRDDRLLIVERLAWLGMDVLIAIYVLEDELERLVCIGRVINIQQNDLVQIEVALAPNGFGASSEAEIWSTLDGARKDSILIKPGLFLGGLRYDRVR